MRALDLVAWIGMVVAVGVMLQPWWDDGLRYGFFATLLFTVLHIFTSHRRTAS
jgi:hypothetical protein